MFRDKLFIDHIVLTVAGLPESKIFYSKMFGNPDFETDDSIMFVINSTRLFLVQQKPDEYIGTVFNPNRIGLEYLAFGIRSLPELKEIEAALNKEAIKHSGIHIDNHSNREKIWLNDPSGIRIEFFLRA